MSSTHPLPSFTCFGFDVSRCFGVELLCFRWPFIVDLSLLTTLPTTPCCLYRAFVGVPIHSKGIYIVSIDYWVVFMCQGLLFGLYISSLSCYFIIIITYTCTTPCRLYFDDIGPSMVPPFTQKVYI